jgi:hypothetical protein
MRNLAGRVRFSLMSTRDFEDLDLATRIVNLLLSLPFDVRPDIFDVYEPLKRKVEPANDIVDLLLHCLAGRSKSTIPRQVHLRHGDSRTPHASALDQAGRWSGYS